ncbi:MAG: hypothetical protein ACE5F9_14170, partial [Phycisphaerae bacterium]
MSRSRNPRGVPRRRDALRCAGRCVFLCALPVAAAAVLGGCARRTTTCFDVVTFKDPERSDHFSQAFDPGAFAIDAQNRYDIVFERRDSVSLSGEERPAGSNGDETSLVALSQFIHIRVFWRPRPGSTFAERTQTNANIVYGLRRGDDVISYEGAGFVYFTMSRDEKTITGAIESATLGPGRSAGRPGDYFGPCHLSGSFTAQADRHRVVSVLHEVVRRLGPPEAPAGTRIPSRSRLP